MSSPLKDYRPDIDGLRAVAVLLVVLYHSELGCAGGFIGVDVFFVISGYLITRNILRDHSAGTFTLSTFWRRRILRLFPASAVMTLATLLAGSVFLLPGDYEELAESALMQLCVSSNIYFWRQSDYFAGPSDLKPLLHTWSLAVEEQFYIIYPTVLLLLLRRPGGRLAVPLGLATVASFFLSVWGVRTYPDATFFLLPTRAWELLLGALICLAPKSIAPASSIREGLAFSGLGAIVLTGFFYWEEMTFPAEAALVPCLGASAVIWSNTGRLTSVGRLLSFRPAVLVGMISYSLYLWHWPILVYLRHRGGGILSREASVAAVIASFAAAFLSWLALEQPFRRAGIGWPLWRLTFSGAAFSGVALTSAVILVLEGAPDRVDPKVLAFLTAPVERKKSLDTSIEDVRSGKVPMLGMTKHARRCVLWGDSHAAVLATGLEAACSARNISVFQATHSGTPPLLDFVFVARHGLSDQTPAYSSAVVEFCRRERVDIVVLAGVWKTYAAKSDFGDKLRRTIEALRESGVCVGVVKDVAFQDSHVPALIASAMFHGRTTDSIGVSVDRHRAENAECDAILKNVSSSGAVVLDPAPFFVGPDGVWRACRGSEALYYDKHHLSPSGSLLLKPMFEEFLGGCKCTECGEPGGTALGGDRMHRSVSSATDGPQEQPEKLGDR